MAGISLQMTAGPALREIKKLDSAINRLKSKSKGRASSGKSSQKSKAGVTDRLRKVVARSVAIHIANTQELLIEQTPYWSGFLVSNWGLSQGRQPNPGKLINRAEKEVDIVVSPSGDEFQLPVRGQFDAPPLLSPDDIDGTKYQVLYNNVSYAYDVSLGYGPSKKNDYKVISGGGPDWFLVSGAYFSDPGNYRKNFRDAARSVNLG